jgi:hypothetical protein
VGDEPTKIILVGIYERPGKDCDDGGDAMAAIDCLKGGHYIVGQEHPVAPSVLEITGEGLYLREDVIF